MTAEDSVAAEPPLPKKGPLRPALAWVAALLVNAFAYLVMLAGAMRTVPRFDPIEAVIAGLGPGAFAALFFWGVVRNVRSQSWGRALAGYGLPFAACAFWVLVVVGSYLSAPSG